MSAPRPGVMIVDGHEDSLLLLERLFENEGFDTLTAWSGADALQLLRRSRFDIFVVNEYLPDVDCEDFMAYVNAKVSAAHFVVMQPSAPAMVKADRLRELGACHIVQKRAQRELVAAVQDCSAGATHHMGSTLKGKIPKNHMSIEPRSE